MDRKQLLSIVAAALCASVFAQSDADIGNGWRLTVGGQFEFKPSGKFSVKAESIPVPAPVFRSSKSRAKSEGDKIAVGKGRSNLPNGAFVDTSDAAGQPDETWNWYIPAGMMNDGTMSFASKYTEHSTVYETFGGSCSDENTVAGASIGLERNLVSKGPFGVDVGFDFAFFRKDDWFSGFAGGYTRIDRYSEGEYRTKIDMGNADVMEDEWTQNEDGSYGAGTFDGPGPVISVSDISVSHGWGARKSRATRAITGPFAICGDLEMYEFQLGVKPYFELTDWFLIRAIAGLGLDYRRFDVRFGDFGSDAVNDWDVYMVLGAGAMIRWDCFCIGADFLKKAFDDDMDIDTSFLNGKIGTADWVLKVYAGYEL